jgi:ABC-type polysaccharide/polyol phosphate transport system ATPase subunit
VPAPASPVTVEPGEIVLCEACRTFAIRADHGRTLKEILIGRRRTGGPPPVHALRDVSLRIGRGETVGIVGRNGAGKSSTLRVLAGIIPLHAGRAACGGRVVSLLELGAGFGRDFSGRENIELNGALHGLTREEVARRMEPIIAFSELGEFIDVPVRTYSSGMYVRLGFAIAAHLDPDVLLIDEVLAVGDEAFQRKCLRRISEQIATGATLVLVSHEPGAIERVCQRVVVLEDGRVVFDGPTADGLLHYHRMLGVEDDRAGAPRPGTGSETLGEPELCDAEGRRRAAWRCGDTLRVEVEVRASDPSTVRLEVRDIRGTRLFHTRTVVDPGAGDRARLAFCIPRLALLGGDYDLALGTGEEGGFQRVARFSVLHEPDAGGVVDLRGQWTRLHERAPA